MKRKSSITDYFGFCFEVVGQRKQWLIIGVIIYAFTLGACLTGIESKKFRNEYATDGVSDAEMSDSDIDAGKRHKLVSGEQKEKFTMDAEVADAKEGEEIPVEDAYADAAEDACIDATEDACIDATEEQPRNIREVEVDIAKWFGNRTAAISLTYDTGAPKKDPDTIDSIVEHGLTMDYEVVTTNIREEKLDFINTVMLPSGLGFFGHGDTHTNHDKMTYEEALESATNNFEAMRRWGLHPVAFAYPGGQGSQRETQNAITAAGFLSARGHAVRSDVYITPDDEEEPRNWYLLPDLVMESYDYRQKSCVNDTSDLIPFLDGALERTAWIILTYHSIGNPDGFGFYYREDFERDLDEIAERDFWVAGMGDTTLYVRERMNAAASAVWRFDENNDVTQIEVFIEDGLPNDIYVQPLTLLFEVPKSWVGELLEIQGPNGRLPDQKAENPRAALSFIPSESRYTVTLAEAAYPDVKDDEDAGAE